MLVYLLELLDGRDAGGAPVNAYFGEAGYNRRGAPAYYEARLKTGTGTAIFTRSIFAAGEFGGRASTAYGSLALLNGDGALDWMRACAWDGATARLLLVDRLAAYDSAKVVLTAMVRTIVPGGVNGNELVIALRDRAELFDMPIQPRLMAGTNDMATIFVEGDEEQEGDPYPIAYGPVFNATPVMVCAQLGLYALNDTQSAGIDAVKDGGVPAAVGLARTLAEITDPETVPLAGGYDWCLGAADTPTYLRLGFEPAAGLTVDFRGTVRNGVFLTSAAQIIRDIAVHRVGMAAADIHAADLAAIDTAAPWPLSLYVDSDTDASEVLDRIAVSVCAWWGFDRLDRLRLQRIAPPDGDPVLTLTRFRQAEGPTTPQHGDILALSWTATDQVGWGEIPAHAVRLAWGPNWTEQDTGALLGSTGPEDPDPVGGAAMRDRLADAWRYVVTPVDEAVAARHRLADRLEIETLIAGAAEAGVAAAERATLHGVARELPTARVQIDLATVEALDIGLVTRHRVRRFGWDAGKAFRIIGLKIDLRTGTADLFEWG